nr:hypothetical protein [Tanacetum cinerariifolium]
DKGKGKLDDKGKENVDDLQDKVDRLEKANSKLMVSEKGTKKASVYLVDALDLQNRIKKLYEDFNMLVKAQKTKDAKEAKVVEVSSDEEDFSDEGFFGDEDVVLFNVVKYPLTDAEIRMFKERPTTSRDLIASTSTTSRSIVPIASTSNAQATSTAPRWYRKTTIVAIQNTPFGRSWLIKEHNMKHALFLQLVDERLLLPPKQTPPEADKNSCTRLLMDLLTQKRYTHKRDDIINIISLRKHSSLDTYFNPLKSKP